MLGPPMRTPSASRPPSTHDGWASAYRRRHRKVRRRGQLFFTPALCCAMLGTAERGGAPVPTCSLYLPPEAARRIDAAAQRLCLSRKDFLRAVSLAVAAR